MPIEEMLVWMTNYGDILVAAAVGFLVGWILSKSRHGGIHTRIQLEQREKIASLEATLEKERALAEQKIALLENAKANFAEIYRVLSVKALRENNRIFLDLARTTLSKYVASATSEVESKGQTIERMVEPIVSALNKYDQQVQAMEQTRKEAYGGLSQQLKLLVNTQNILQKETGNLAKALRVPHVRGRWGEITLRRVAELAGMQNRCDFFEQSVVGQGQRRLRPDMVIQLPGQRQIAVDAKAPLEAYLRALEADTEDQRESLLQEHAQQVQGHINQLAKKSYWTHLQPTPEFVILFIPGENFFAAALAQNPGLIDEGAGKNVVLATPTTMISLLKTVALGWRQETANRNSEEIRQLGDLLYQRLVTLVKHLNALGKDLERTRESYNKVVGSFERRVFSAARNFRSLGVSNDENEPLEVNESHGTVLRKCNLDSTT